MATPIDAVILWVDGNDPVLNEKRRKYAPDFLFGHDHIRKFYHNGAGEKRRIDVKRFV